MYEIRMAQKGEVASQKEIWRLCFGDRERYIDFYYANRYKEEETVLFLHDGKIASMVTLVPVRTVTAENRSFASVMVYAYATHPMYQKRGFATRIMEFANQHLVESRKDFSILVPQAKDLFDFYRERGYQEAFYLKEAVLTRDEIDRFAMGTTGSCTISAGSPESYNQIRNERLRDHFHIAYADIDIVYQKKLSQLSGADIYHVDAGGIQGCAVVEKISAEKILIKEMLLPDEWIPAFLKNVAEEFAAQEYYLRTPAFTSATIKGTVRPFGMIRNHRPAETLITPEDQGYLGLAFD